MASKYDYSKPINLWLTTDSKEYTSLVTKLLDIIEVELKTSLGITRFRKQDHSKALFHILADLFVTYIADNKRYLAFSRDRVWYSKSTRYQPKDFAFKPFLRVVDALDSLGYIESTKGFQDLKTGVNRQARMIAAEKLATLFSNRKLTPANFYQLHTKESIILKSPKDESGNKQLLDYEDTPDTQLMRENLKLINDNIGKQWVDLKITDKQFYELQVKLSESKDKHKLPVDFTKTSQVRIFNNGIVGNPQFNQGGRFYGGWWLSIPSAYRSRIRINGKKTIELDYSAMHFYMMYAEKGLVVPDGDPYLLDNIDRKKAKLALNTALNAPNKENAISSIKANHWPNKTKIEVTNTLDKLLAKHKAISEFFYTGKGLALQFKDSQVAELVMLNMWNMHGTIVLPVHDSFIVSAAFYDTLKAEMLIAFHDITGYKAKLKASEPDEILKSDLDKLAQNIEYDDSGKLTKVGVNAADTWEAYKKDKDIYSGYLSRKFDRECINKVI